MNSSRNLIRTDGAGIDFIFKKPKRETVSTTPAHWRRLLEGSTIWGIDPGLTDLFVAADGDEVDPHRIRRTSTKEYYHICGFNAASRKRDNWKRQNQEAARIIDAIPTLKTASTQVLNTATAYILLNYATITSFVDLQFRFNKLKLKVYGQKQKGLSEIGKRLTYGSRKYSQRLQESPVARTTHWTALPSFDTPVEQVPHIFLAFGNGNFGNVGGKLSAPTKRLLSHLRQISRIKADIHIITIDEYLTSQVCANCHRRTLEKMPATKGKADPKIHAVLKCNSCRTVWNRDTMAAKNIRHIFRYMAEHNNERPEMFRRPPRIVEDSLAREEPPGSSERP